MTELMDMRLIAAEGAIRENIFDNEESGGGAGRLSRRGSAAGGTTLAVSRHAKWHLLPQNEAN